MTYTGFIPCRAGSERVKNKNTRPFAGYQGGLLELKLRQLAGVPELDEIIVSSNDGIVLEFAEAFAKSTDPRVTPIERPNELGVSSTSMEAFIADYIAHLRDDSTLFWTHVTHPFVHPAIYSEAIRRYENCLNEGFDSLISATKLQTFLWRDGKPFNYDNSVEKWPRSQDIPPVWEINHAIYIMTFELIRKTGDRIGGKPFFFEMEARDAMDIDWEDQFKVMDELFAARRAGGDTLV